MAEGLKWFEYDQNNSGGSFVLDDDVALRVYVEASNYKEANSMAQGIGIYFDGCDLGLDCDCCGDRWTEPWDSSGMTADEMEDLREDARPYDVVWAGADKPAVYYYFHDGRKVAEYLTVDEDTETGIGVSLEVVNGG